MRSVPIRLLLPIVATVVLGLVAEPGAAPAEDAAGFIHGAVITREGDEHVGLLRWRNEEAFWNDLFQSSQLESPWLDHADLEALEQARKRRYFAEHGLLDRVIWSLSDHDGDLRHGHLFVHRFGDLSSLRIGEDDDVTAVMRDGREVSIGGYSNDVSSDIIVYGDTASITFDWDELSEIRFFASPAGTSPYASRLHGEVEFRGGVFSGAIQWDKSECTSIDILDSDSEDLPMGRIRSLTRARAGGTDAVLDDGTEMNLAGTNDVDGGNRGIMVEVVGLGRVTIPWKRFQRATFGPAPDSGPAYSAFADPLPLRGAVSDRQGRRFEGRLVYDLDEAWTSDIFDGERDECEYAVPFGLIREIVPAENGGCRLVLGNGTTLELSGTRDCGADNAGVLVFAPGESGPVHLLWPDVARLELAP